MKRQLLYFSLALLPAVLVAEQPKDGWHWFLWGGLGLYQGLLALKALDSSPSGQATEANKTLTASLNKLEDINSGKLDKPTV